MSKPEKVFKAGAVRAAVFRNEVSVNGKTMPMAKVVLEVRYRDKAGNWQGTSSLALNDLPKAMLVLHEAYAYLLEHRDSPDGSAEN